MKNDTLCILLSIDYLRNILVYKVVYTYGLTVYTRTRINTFLLRSSFRYILTRTFERIKKCQFLAHFVCAAKVQALILLRTSDRLNLVRVNGKERWRTSKAWVSITYQTKHYTRRHLIPLPLTRSREG